MNALAALFVLVALVYAGLCAALFAAQRSLPCFPAPGQAQARIVAGTSHDSISAAAEYRAALAAFLLADAR